MTFWDTRPEFYFHMVKQWDVAKPQIKIVVSGKYNIFTTNTVGKIMAWSTDRSEAKFALDEHTDLVTATIFLPD